MAQCPRCKEDMPLLSKICPVCGYVEEGGDENNMSVSDFVKVLEARLNEIKYIPEPSFMKGMGHFTFVIYPILAIAFLLVFLISDSGLFLLAFALFLILSIIAIVKKTKGRLGYDPFNQWFKIVQSDFDYHKRIAKHSFGKNSEVSRLIDDISGEIKTVEKKRSAALRKNTIIWSVIVVILLGMAVLGVTSTQSVISGKQATEENSAHLLQEYEAGNVTDTEQARLNIINALLAEGNTANAEKFFLTECMGNARDMDGATAIVKHYNKVSDADGAKSFVDRCTGIRYNSDKEKLYKLITTED